MAHPQLRVFAGPDAANPAEDSQTPQVRVALGDILPALLDAARTNRTWIADFADEEVAVSQDLYELIMAYQYFCRPAAG